MSLIVAMIAGVLVNLTLTAAHVHMDWYGWFTAPGLFGLLIGFIDSATQDAVINVKKV